MQNVEKKIFKLILMEIEKNPKVTEKEIAKKYFYSERTIRRYFKFLKDKDRIKLVGLGKKRTWLIVR